MRKLTGLCFILMICSAQLLHAQSIEKKLQLSLSSGYQQQDFHWSIAGNNVNVLSELKWKNVGGQTINASAQWNVWKRFSVYASYSRQFIQSGKANDTDYDGDNRTMVQNIGSFDANRGNTQDWNIGAGYIIINNHNFSLTPYIGYGVSTQSFQLIQPGRTPSDTVGTYLPDWKGPFIKIISSLRIVKNLRFTANATYNQVSYNSNANWKLITQYQHPVSYRHHANGYGLNAGGRLSYDVTSYFSIYAGGSYFTWQTGHGTDKLYYTDGKVDITLLNEAIRSGFQVFGGVAFGL